MGRNWKGFKGKSEPESKFDFKFECKSEFQFQFESEFKFEFESEFKSETKIKNRELLIEFSYRVFCRMFELHKRDQRVFHRKHHLNTWIAYFRNYLIRQFDRLLFLIPQQGHIFYLKL